LGYSIFNIHLYAKFIKKEITINTPPEISIVIPLYNEEEIFNQLVKRLDSIIEASKHHLEIVLVNDGSKDKTPLLMKELASSKKNYSAVFLSRNFGHQLAVSAGLEQALGTKAVMVIDGDLQDPPELLSTFYEKLQEGYDVVYAIRKKRKENVIKKSAYYLFYRLLNSISYIQLPVDTGDFCLMSRRVVNQLTQMPENSRYLRGMRSWVGYKQVGVTYERDERAAGEPKYNFRMLFGLAYNGIFNFSEFPIKLVTKIGLTGIAFSILYLLYTIYLKLFTEQVPEGFTSLIFVVILFGSLNLFSLGVLGEYITRIFFQVKQRPLYIIESVIQNQNYIEHD